MNYASVLFFGVFLSFAFSWAGLILFPQVQLGRQPLAKSQDGQLYPAERNGLAAQGREVYRSLGCASCHTMQVRDTDVPRWGKRFSVAQDYLRDQSVLVGNLRIGPDLMTIGERMPDAQWHYRHLYQPNLVLAESVLKKSPMPSYHFLFEKRKIGRTKSADALKLPPEANIEAGYEIVPTTKAVALVSYLQSLTLTNYLFEVPNPNPPKPNTNQPPGFVRGQELYATTCGACHQANGEGLAGQFPPLAGSEWALANDPSRIIRVVLNGASGPIEVKGASFNNAMVPWKDVLPDDDIAAVLTYVRNEWGNAAPAVTPEQVSAIREKVKDRLDPWTSEELLKIDLAPGAPGK